MFHGTHPDVLLHHLAYSYIVTEAITKSVNMNTSLVPRPEEEKEKGPGLSHSTHVLNLTDCSSVRGCVLAKTVDFMMSPFIKCKHHMTIT